MRRSKSTPDVCKICDRSQKQCPGHKPAPIRWCPPANARGALTHSDWARVGWKLF